MVDSRQYTPGRKVQTRAVMDQKAFRLSVRPGGQWQGSNPQQKGPCRSQGGFGIVTLSHVLKERASPQQGDLRLAGPPSGQDTGGGTQTRDRQVPADLRTEPLATEPPTPLLSEENSHGYYKWHSWK
ncbi:hypothetical protein PoB_001757100 [Plakobranchus ocellatus]|uniref:Uncharacterized protein n=1 Tax=Plakobranchus ocellatus TaxID=259542 RepID=A0AAV3Z5C1_9GAST|nr:hypothetical protein PoB_001757100 [Plakobranchus ocellatus]